MILLVPKINLLNYHLFLFLSFRYQIKAYKIQPFLYRSKGRIELLDMSDYFSWEECIVVKSDAADIWENILPRFPLSNWKLRIRGYCIDLSIKAKQDFQQEIEKLLFLKHIISFYEKKGKKAWIINSLRFNFISRTDRPNEFFCYPTMKFLSLINVSLDRINLAAENFLKFSFIICQFVIGFIKNRKITAEIRYLYDSVSPKELSIDKDNITFSWIIDGRLVHKKDVFFLLPKADFQMKTQAKDYTRDRELLAINRLNMLSMASYKKLFSCLPELFKILVKDILIPGWGLEHLLVTEYAIRIACWIPIAESLKPKVYIGNCSNVGFEDPAIIYFKAIGVKTVFWTYGTNSYLFCKDKRDCRFRNILFCHILSSNFIVWNKHFKEFVEEHPQDGLQVHVIGPLMSSDEGVMYDDREALLAKLGLAYKSTFKYVAIFDAPAGSRRRSFAYYPNYCTDDYNYAFLRDIYGLLDDLQNVILVYKPKRSLTSGKFSYSDKLKKLLKEAGQNQRMIVLDYNVNPWIPIAMADMCISMPFESPTVAALHYGKPAIFHDPFGIVNYHRYSKIKQLTTHNSSQLKKLAENFLFNPSSFKDMYKEMNISNFVGAEPGTNSSTKFREFLNNI